MATDRPVSTRITKDLIDASRATEWPFVVQLPPHLDPQLLELDASWIPWVDYQDVLVALAGGSEAPEDLRRVSELYLDYAARGAFRHVGHLAGGLAPLYRATFVWVMPSSLRCVQASIDLLEDRQLRITLELDGSEASGERFFHAVVGTAIALPRVLGQPDAAVRSEVSTHAATLHVTLAPSASVWARTRRAWLAFQDQQGLDFATEQLHESVQELVDELGQANRKLRASEERWRSLADGLPGVVVVLRADGHIETMHGATIPPTATLDRILEAFWTPSISGAVFDEGARVSFEVKEGAGETRQAWSCGASRFGAGMATLIAVDRTEHSRAEWALRRSQEQFLQAQKMEALGRLASGVAHDFNNLMTAVQGHTQLLQATLSYNAAALGHVAGIEDAVRRGASLSQQLLAYGRRPSVEPEAVDVCQVVASSERLLTRLVGGGQLSLQATCEASPQPVRVDESQVAQILMNLVVNARDAMPQGGVVRLRCFGRTDAVGDAWVHLEVEDEGQGMPQEVVDRAFEPFFTTKEAGRGTGLGLSTVYWIVEQAGGRAELDTSPGRGTTVRIVLPRAITPSEEEVQPRPRTTTGHILLVEDEEMVRTAMSGMLRAMGYEVMACANAAEALEAVAGRWPDVLVTDETMPGLTGSQLATRLREEQPELPVLLVSGFSETPPSVAGDRVSFLAKPFTMKGLGDAIGELCRAI